jgi:hypothetical protein
LGPLGLPPSAGLLLSLLLLLLLRLRLVLADRRGFWRTFFAAAARANERE